MKTSSSGAAMAAAAASLLISGMVISAQSVAAKEHCMQNACRGVSACKGSKPDSSACKGHGPNKLAEATCKKVVHRPDNS